MKFSFYFQFTMEYKKTNLQTVNAFESAGIAAASAPGVEPHLMHRKILPLHLDAIFGLKERILSLKNSIGSFRFVLEKSGLARPLTYFSASYYQKGLIKFPDFKKRKQINNKINRIKERHEG